MPRGVPSKPKTCPICRSEFILQRGFDQIFKTDYGKGTDNELLMLSYGYLPVYDCGQKVFTYES